MAGRTRCTNSDCGCQFTFEGTSKVEKGYKCFMCGSLVKEFKEEIEIPVEEEKEVIMEVKKRGRKPNKEKSITKKNKRKSKEK